MILPKSELRLWRANSVCSFLCCGRRRLNKVTRHTWKNGLGTPGHGEITWCSCKPYVLQMVTIAWRVKGPCMNVSRGCCSSAVVSESVSLTSSHTPCIRNQTQLGRRVRVFSFLESPNLYLGSVTTWTDLCNQPGLGVPLKAASGLAY
jgi:hypothetical protein